MDDRTQDPETQIANLGKIEITPEDAEIYNHLIVEADLEMARLRYGIKFDEDGIEEARGIVLRQVVEDAEKAEPGDKSLSSEAKIKMEVERRLSEIPSIIDRRKANDCKRERLVYLAIERDSFERTWRTIRAFAHTAPIHLTASGSGRVGALPMIEVGDNGR